MKLAHSTWLEAKDYFARRDLVVLPVGSLENHGSHLALGTDGIIPSYLVDLMAEKLDVAFAPTMPFGVADHHLSFPGTVSIGLDGLYMVMKKVVDDFYHHGARKFVFLNGHGGNDPALNRIGLEMAPQGALCAILDWWVIAGDLNPAWRGGHGAGEETAAMMAIDPALVKMGFFCDYTPQDLSDQLTYDRGSNVLCNGISVNVPRDVVQYAPPGWFGSDHPTTANAIWGQEMLEATAQFCIDFIEKFQKVQWHGEIS